MRSLLFSALVVGLVLHATGSVRAQDETRAILEKALKAHGGADKLAKEQATQTKSKGTLDIAGMTLNFTEDTFTQTGRLKSVLNLEIAGQNIKQTTVFNGEKAWIEVQGNTTELKDQLLDEMKEAVYLSRAIRLVFLKEKGYQLSLLGEVKVNDKPAVGVKIASKGHRDVNLYFDKGSGLLAKIERQTFDAMANKEITEERILTEYQEVDGMKVPKKVLVNRDGKKFMEAEVLEVKFLDKLDDSAFAKP